MGIFSYYSEKERLRKEIIGKAAKITERIRHSLVYPLWNFEKQLTEKIVLLEMEDREVYAIFVKIHENQFYIGKIKNWKWEIKDYAAAEESDQILTKSYLIHRKPIERDNFSLGIVELYFTDHFMKQDLANVIMKVVLQLLLVLFFSLLIIFLSLKQTIIKPIQVLTEGVKKFRLKDFKYRLKITQKNELGLLANIYNSMADEIKNYTECLEDRVAERTEDLKHSNQILEEQNALIQQELKMARKLQRRIIPFEGNFPVRKEFHLGSSYKAMESIGGDLYDIMTVSPNTYGYLMADVSGHGVTAAMITTMIKLAFQTHVKPDLSTGEICAAVNKDIYRILGDSGLYFTAFFCLLDLESGRLQYTLAGHPPPLLYRKDDGQVMRLAEKTDSFLGIFEGEKYDTCSLDLKERDRILLFTDGILEAVNSKNEMFGESRLKDYLSTRNHLDVKQFVQELMREISDFCGGRPPRDDRAVLCIDFIKKMNRGETNTGLVIYSKKELKKTAFSQENRRE
ncbi:MAG: hypothetical protein A2Y41_10105 [Spirochaetes bacterium GWB1_36_13]|nr:MAG: hypothetical protein A2Y41_10105 [Spirochaetes bacterium GWB1_36_13]